MLHFTFKAAGTTLTFCITADRDWPGLMTLKTVVLCAIALAPRNCLIGLMLRRSNQHRNFSTPESLRDCKPRLNAVFRLRSKMGNPLVRQRTVQHSGTFNMGATAENWKPFTPALLVITRHPGFDWNARAWYFLTLQCVYDAYAAGLGLLEGSAAAGKVNLLSVLLHEYGHPRVWSTVQIQVTEWPPACNPASASCRAPKRWP